MRVPPLFQCSYKALAIRFIAFGILGVFIGECVNAITWAIDDEFSNFTRFRNRLSDIASAAYPYSRLQSITKVITNLGEGYGHYWERSPWGLRMLFSAMIGAIVGTLFYAALRYWATKVEKRNTKGNAIG